MHDYHNVFEREGRHHKGISTLCCQCVCYIIFLTLYLLTVFLSNESSKSYFFQQHIQDIFNLKSESFMQSCGNGAAIIGPQKFKSIQGIESYFESCILQNPQITYKNTTSLTPITATIQPDHMVVILGKVLVREYNVRYNVGSLSNDYSVCKFEDLKSHYAKSCELMKSYQSSTVDSTDDATTAVANSVGSYGYSGSWYEGNGGSRNILLSLDSTREMQWHDKISNKLSNQTKYVLIEINFLSGHTLQFGSLRIGFEKTSSGSVESTHKFFAENLFNFRSLLQLLSSNIVGLQAQVRLLEFLLVVLSSIYLIPAIFNWLTYGTVAYLGKIWNILPLVNCRFSS